MSNLQHRRRMGRAGFSLIELLVAISIMAIVITTLVVSLQAVGGSARRSSTATTLRKLDSLVQERFEEIRSNFKEQEDKKLRAAMTTLPDQQRNWITILSAAEMPSFLPVPGLPVSAKVVVAKFDRYRGTFPQREEDLFGPDGNEATAGDNSPLLVQWRTFNSTTKTNRTLESSELLNLALTFGVSAGRGREVVDSLKKSHVQDKDGNGLAELYDDWGNPLRFYNAPTRLVRPGGVGTLPTQAQLAAANQLMTGIPSQAGSPTDFTSAFNQDPFDSKGALRQLSSGAGVPSWYVAPAVIETAYHTVDTYYRPLIVSCGEDGALGMGEPAPPMPLSGGTQFYDRLGRILDEETASDNITSLQAGGAQ
jgi:prepilin-type N-terminal cleavage/methylation domain-containing protein